MNDSELDAFTGVFGDMIWLSGIWFQIDDSELDDFTGVFGLIHEC